MNFKKSATIEEQIVSLKSKGIEIVDENKAKTILENLNYYKLKGYLLEFKNIETGLYQNSPTFERVYGIYEFDGSLRNIFLFAAEKVEHSIKTRIAHEIALQYPNNPHIYEDENFFRCKDDHKRFLKSFRDNVKNRRKTPFVAHHINKYRSQFPIWVAVELFTLGDIQYLYKNIPNRLRRKISSGFNVSPDIFDSWIDNLRRTRNHIAHSMRVYNTSFSFSPKHSKDFQEGLVLSNRIFDQFYLLKMLYPDNCDWFDVSGRLDMLIHRYRTAIELKAIGFPGNWKRFLMDD